MPNNGGTIRLRCDRDAEAASYPSSSIDLGDGRISSLRGRFQKFVRGSGWEGGYGVERSPNNGRMIHLRVHSSGRGGHGAYRARERAASRRRPSLCKPLCEPFIPMYCSTGTYIRNFGTVLRWGPSPQTGGKASRYPLNRGRLEGISLPCVPGRLPLWPPRNFLRQTPYVRATCVRHTYALWTYLETFL